MARHTKSIPTTLRDAAVGVVSCAVAGAFSWGVLVVLGYGALALAKYLAVSPDELSFLAVLGYPTKNSNIAVIGTGFFLYALLVIFVVGSILTMVISSMSWVGELVIEELRPRRGPKAP